MKDLNIHFRRGFAPGEHDEVCPMRKCTACRTGEFAECEATDVEHPCWCVPIRMGRSVERYEIWGELTDYLNTNHTYTVGGRHARWQA